MRVLWFSLASPFPTRGDFHNGGGWMSSLAPALARQPGVTLGIAYEGVGAFGAMREGICLYPIGCFQHWKNKLRRIWSPRTEEELLLQECRSVLAEFRPEVIHVWGTESAYGLIAGESPVPCILHIQGLLGPYYNAQFPPGFNACELRRFHRWRPVERLRLWLLDRVRRYRAERETRILRSCGNYLGRTAWDQAVVRLFNPGARYRYCSEMLRAPFWEARGQWRRQERAPRRIVSVLSMPTYKGHDLILKTAKLLKEHCAFEFTWEVYGVWSMGLWEEHLGISGREVGVRCCGTVDAAKLKGVLLEADLFVHPSYADNSPNSLCEAQLLGLPVISTYVGGVPSLVRENETGFLVPANEPYMLAERILSVFEDASLAKRLGRNAAHVAEKRHAPDAILHDLLAAYRAIQG